MVNKRKNQAKSDAQKDREEFKKLQKDKKVAQLQYRMRKTQMVARLSQQESRPRKGDTSRISCNETRLSQQEDSLDNISENLEKFIKTNLDKIGVKYKHYYRQGSRTHIVNIDPKDHQKVTKNIKTQITHLKIVIRDMKEVKFKKSK